VSCGGRFSSCSYCVDSPTEFSDLSGQLGRVGEEVHKQPPFSVYQLISLQTLAAALGNTCVAAQTGELSAWPPVTPSAGPAVPLPSPENCGLAVDLGLRQTHLHTCKQAMMSRDQGKDKAAMGVILTHDTLQSRLNVNVGTPSIEHILRANLSLESTVSLGSFTGWRLLLFIASCVIQLRRLHKDNNLRVISHFNMYLCTMYMLNLSHLTV
jgi:hypothetical protein